MGHWCPAQGRHNPIAVLVAEAPVRHRVKVSWQDPCPRESSMALDWRTSRSPRLSAMRRLHELEVEEATIFAEFPELRPTPCKTVERPGTRWVPRRSAGSPQRTKTDPPLQLH